MKCGLAWRVLLSYLEGEGSRAGREAGTEAGTEAGVGRRDWCLHMAGFESMFGDVSRIGFENTIEVVSKIGFGMMSRTEEVSKIGFEMMSKIGVVSRIALQAVSRIQVQSKALFVNRVECVSRTWVVSRTELIVVSRVVSLRRAVCLGRAGAAGWRVVRGLEGEGVGSCLPRHPHHPPPPPPRGVYQSQTAGSVSSSALPDELSPVPADSLAPTPSPETNIQLRKVTFPTEQTHDMQTGSKRHTQAW